MLDLIKKQVAIWLPYVNLKGVSVLQPTTNENRMDIKIDWTLYEGNAMELEHIALTVGGGVGIAENAVIGQKLTAVGNFFYYTPPVSDNTAIDSELLDHTIGAGTGGAGHLAAFMSGLYIKSGNLGSAPASPNETGTYTLPSAATIVSNIPGCVVGSSFRLVVKNNMYGTASWGGADPSGNIHLAHNTGLTLFKKNSISVVTSGEFELEGSSNSAVTGKTYEFQVIVTDIGTPKKVDIVRIW